MELPIYCRPWSFWGIWVYIGGRSTSVDLRAIHEAGGAPRGSGRAPHPRGQPGTLLAQLFYSRGFFWSITNHQKLARQLDSVWYSFSVKLKNKEKQKLALGSRLIG